MDDSGYPYAGLPRLVIETEGFREIRNTKTKIPAKLQIYGEDAPDGDVLDLTLKGRGNSSFQMAKFGYKMEFENKQSLFGMPKDKDWNLIANQRDKSLLRNFATFELAKRLGDDYVPRAVFVEVYLNRKYMGVFQLAEHIKVGKNRVNIPKNDSCFLIEKTSPSTSGVEGGSSADKSLLKSSDSSLFVTKLGKIYKIKSPKNPTAESASLIAGHVDGFEDFLQSEVVSSMDSLGEWFDVEELLRFYMVQEFSKNVDGNNRSIFITWEKGAPMRMGPVWDFDLAYGVSSFRKISPQGFSIRYAHWYYYLFKSEAFRKAVSAYWAAHRDAFLQMEADIDSAASGLAAAAENEFKRWPVLEEDDIWPFIESFGSYGAAVDSLKSWIKARIEWMDGNL